MLKRSVSHDARLGSRDARLEVEAHRWLEVLRERPIAKARSAPVLPAVGSGDGAPAGGDGGNGDVGDTGGGPNRPSLGSLKRQFSTWGRSSHSLLKATHGVSRPPPGLETQALRLYRQGVPDPVARAAASFDVRQREGQRKCEIALRAVRETPASTAVAEDFERRVSDLFWTRYSLDAPVERQALAYPDPIWGVPLDQVGQTSGGDRSQHHYAGGLAFTASPERGKTPVRPRLPALRPAAQRPSRFMLLPDSHHALGGFCDDGKEYTRQRAQVARRIWSVEISLFRPRKHGPVPCDSADYHDSEECRGRAFQKDWATTTGAAVLHALSKDPQAAGRAFGTTKLSAAQLRDIRAALAVGYARLLVLFSYYGALDAGASGSVYGLTKLGYAALARDAGLVGDGSHLEKIGAADGGEGESGSNIVDLMWVSVNECMVAKKQAYNSKGRLIRWELIEWVVRMAFEEVRPLTPQTLLNCTPR